MIDALGAQRTLEVVTEPSEQNMQGGQTGPLHASEGQGVPAHAAKEEEEPFWGKRKWQFPGYGLGFRSGPVYLLACFGIQCAGRRIRNQPLCMEHH